jgi:hypothetical protein
VVKIISKPFGILSFYSYISSVMRETLNPLTDMINPMITLNEIRTFAENNNAAEFDRWCDINGIPNEWLDVTLTDFNDGYYNVDLFAHGVNVMYYNGVLEEITEL